MRNEYNFDHPGVMAYNNNTCSYACVVCVDALDFDLMVETLRKLKEGKRVEVCSECVFVRVCCMTSLMILLFRFQCMILPLTVEPSPL